MPAAMREELTVLVTGGAGFIGSAVCRDWAARLGWRVIALDKLGYAASLQALAPVAKLENFTLEVCDVCDRAALDLAFAAYRPDAVAHLAAETHVDRSINAPAAFIRTNVQGTATVLDAALAYWRGLHGDRQARFRLLHVSTDEVYGSLGPQGAFRETSPLDPRSPYAASKAAGDHLALAYANTYGLPVLVSRCSNNYGPYQFPEKLIPLMILAALEERPLPVYGDGLQVRDWLHVQDHVRGLEAILRSGRAGEVYNLGGGAERANLVVVEALCDLLDAERPSAAGSRRRLIRHVADRPGHDRRYAIDAAKAGRELGWSPQIGFGDGLAQTLAWYLARQDWWGPLRARYRGQRLGLDHAG